MSWMRKARTVAGTWSTVALLSACSVTAPRVDRDGAPIAAGMQLQLHERLRVPAHATYSYIQGGQSLHGRLVDQYYPHCRFEMRDLADAPRHIEPDTFTIVRIERETELVQSAPRHYASRMLVSSASATAEAYHTRFYLNSARQPQVELLACSHWEDPTLFARHLSAAEIRDTLKPVASFE